jgi:hypothetical protein
MTLNYAMLSKIPPGTEIWIKTTRSGLQLVIWWSFKLDAATSTLYTTTETGQRTAFSMPEIVHFGTMPP